MEGAQAGKEDAGTQFRCAVAAARGTGRSLNQAEEKETNLKENLEAGLKIWVFVNFGEGGRRGSRVTQVSAQQWLLAGPSLTGEQVGER